MKGIYNKSETGKRQKGQINERVRNKKRQTQGSEEEGSKWRRAA
jgi:hypothetical protein